MPLEQHAPPVHTDPNPVQRNLDAFNAQIEATEDRLIEAAAVRQEAKRLQAEYERLVEEDNLRDETLWPPIRRYGRPPK